MKSMRNAYLIKFLSNVTVGLFAAVCTIPFIMIISGSLSSERSILLNGFSLLPREFSLESYDLLFRSPKVILNAYGVSIFITVAGSAIGLMVTAMSGYVLARPDFRYRNTFAFLFYFSSIFSGGMIPSYILISNYLNMKDNIWVLVIPPLLSAWNIFLMRNYMSGIPISLAESAKLDGANDLTVFIRIYLPLAIPGLATVGLFIALFYWNDWFNAMMYINDQDLFPLQYLLQRMLSSVKALQEAANRTNVTYVTLPTETLKMAMSVVATGPIILVYPFVQKYFVKGIIVGSVKG